MNIQTKHLERNNGIHTVVLDKENIGLVAKIWQNLERKITGISVTSKWDWIETWLSYFSNKVDYWFLVGKKDDEVIGILLLTKETNRPIPFPVKSYHIGTNGEPYQDQIKMIDNSILAYKDYKKKFIKSSLKVVFEKFQVEELVFDDFDEKEARIIYEILRKFPYSISYREEPTLYLDLESIKKHGSVVEDHFGHYMRRSIRRSIKAFGNELEFEWADTSLKALDILDELVKLYLATWQKLGKKGMFSSISFLGFQKDTIVKLLKNNSVILFRVRSKKYGTVGCLYMIVNKNTAYSYQIGVNDFSHVNLDNLSNKRIKTGYIVHTFCMKECLKRGIKKYNLGTGIYPYKKQMTDSLNRVVTVSARSGIRPRLRNTFFDIYGKLEERRQSYKVLRLLRNIFVK